jgi:UDP-N-acetylmuramate dehydrogenase
MIAPLPVEYDVELRRLNTFGVAARARAYLPVRAPAELAAVRAEPTLAALPRLVLGGGSNILLTRDFPGLVLHMLNRGIEVAGADADFSYVRAAAGENWHEFVQWTLAHGLPGLENLSLIPGSVGAAPIQNIGAYGVEVGGLIRAVRAYDWQRGALIELSGAECGFGYRDSVFKRDLRERAVIVEVEFALPRAWRPECRYAELAAELAARGHAVPAARQVADAVIAIRRRKLPDPTELGNAGSFFKNPVVPAVQFEALAARFPGLISFPQAGGARKLAAGWLIEQCGWKGKTVGAAGVYEKQALVLVNRGGARGAEIAALAARIRADVLQRFGVVLEPEPVLI